MEVSKSNGMISLDPADPLWERIFLVSPLVIIGTREEGEGFDLAPKHMVMPLSWENHLGFVCTPRHRTYQNIVRERAFTASYLRPDQVLEASLAAAPAVEKTMPNPACPPSARCPRKQSTACSLTTAISISSVSLTASWTTWAQTA